VTHDVDEAITLADRILVMRSGAIAVEHITNTLPTAVLRQKLLGELGVEFKQEPLQSAILDKGLRS
jgi:sulfonate transport system ATP-binding protein